MKWWQQQLSSNQWSYDTSQPPMVYTAKIGGKTERIVSVATMEGVWFAYNAATGAPIYQRVKVIDNVEHPNLKPGQPVVIYPSSLGGLNYSPASFDPQTHYVYNAASETASVLVQQTPAEEERQALLAGDVFLGLANGDYGQYLQSGWKDYGSVSAIDVATGKQVWKFDTPQPERGGPTTTASGHRLRRRRRRQSPRLRREDGQGALDVPDGLPDRRRAVDLLGQRHRVHRDRRRRHPDLVVRRHGRLAGAGVLARRKHHAVAGARDPDGRDASTTGRRGDEGLRRRRPPLAAARPRTSRRRAGCSSRPGIRTRRTRRWSWVTYGSPASRSPAWSSTSDGWAAAPTDKTGAFEYPVDITAAARHVATIADVDASEDRRQQAFGYPAGRAARTTYRDQRRLLGERRLRPSSAREGTSS